MRVAREAKRPFADADVEVNEADAYVLSVAMPITLAGVEQQWAEEIMETLFHAR
ncbi:MAG: hypothetical protein U1E66_03020 [Rhodospirillales bacterium]